MVMPQDLDELVDAGLITSEQSRRIHDYLQSRNPAATGVPARTSFPLWRTLYYLGGAFILWAIIFYWSTIWDELNSFGRVASALIAMAFFGGVGLYLRRTAYRVSGTVLCLVAVACAPMLVRAVELAAGMAPQSLFLQMSPQSTTPVDEANAAWLLINGVGLVVAVAAALSVRDPLMILPIAWFLWQAEGDLINLLTGARWDQQARNAWWGIPVALLYLAWGFRERQRGRTAYVPWPWIAGFLLLGTEFTILRAEAGQNLELLYQLLVGVFSLAILLLATPLRSLIFLVFGAIGTFIFLQDIAWTHFRDSVGFTLALMLSGLLTIGFGIVIQRLYRKRFAVEPILRNSGGIA